MKELKYRFIKIDNCNMCGALADSHKILGKRLNRSQGKKPRSKTGITTTIMKCTSCGLIFSNPQPIPFNIQDHYGVPPETYWDEQYLLLNQDYFNYEIGILKTLMEIKPGAKALDIGAGLGKAMIALNKEGFDAYGFEASEPFYKKALENNNINPARLKFGMLEEMEYPENEFDFITFGAVLEHLYDPASALDKAVKWLKPGGIIHIEVPSARWFINKLINMYYKLNGSDYVGNISPMHAPFHLYEFDLKSFELHSKKSNYEIILYQYHVCITYMPKFLSFFLIPYMKWTNTGMQLCIWLKKK